MFGTLRSFRCSDAGAVSAIVVAAVFVFAVTLPAAAQRRTRSRLPPCDESSQDARDLYICGLHAVAGLHYLEAVRIFGESYARGHEPAALFNQGLALKSLGRFVEAREIFRRVLREHPDASAEVRSQAETHLAQAQESIVNLRVVVEDDSGRALQAQSFHVEFNGRRMVVNAEGTFEVDPGDAVVVVEAEGFRDARWEGTLVRGSRTLQLEVVAIEPADAQRVVAPVDETVEQTPISPGPSDGDNTVLWVLLAGGAVVVASAAVVSFVLVSDREQQLQLRPAADFRSTDVLRF